MQIIQAAGYVSGDHGYRLMGDESPTLTGSERFIVFGTALTAARSTALVASSGFTAGTVVQFSDVIRGLTSGNTFTIAVASGDYLDGTLNGTLVMNAAGQTYSFRTDGAGHWTSSLGSAAAATTSITGTASTLPINGLAAAQGGSVTVTGGTSSTSANAGGAVAMVGGVPGATGAGGAASLTGGAGGSTSGAGGAASVTGGAGTAGNAVGGAASLIGGAGHGSSAGGAIAITSGAGGATGLPGAINISVGAATASNGAAITLTAGSGAGGTNAGGDINLVPGEAVSTGTPGVFKINSVAGTFDATWNSPLATTVVPASGTAQIFFLASRAYRVTAVSCIEVTHGTSETIDVIHDTGTTAAGGGTSVLTAPMDPHATSMTVVTGTLVSTVATLLLAAGDRLSFKTAGTIGAAAGLYVSVTLVPA